MAEIALDPAFEPTEITADEFEKVWRAAAPLVFPKKGHERR